MSETIPDIKTDKLKEKIQNILNCSAKQFLRKSYSGANFSLDMQYSRKNISSGTAPYAQLCIVKENGKLAKNLVSLIIVSKQEVAQYSSQAQNETTIIKSLEKYSILKSLDFYNQISSVSTITSDSTCCLHPLFALREQENGKYLRFSTDFYHKRKILKKLIDEFVNNDKTLEEIEKKCNYQFGKIISHYIFVPLLHLNSKGDKLESIKEYISELAKHFHQKNFAKQKKELGSLIEHDPKDFQKLQIEDEYLYVSHLVDPKFSGKNSNFYKFLMNQVKSINSIDILSRLEKEAATENQSFTQSQENTNILQNVIGSQVINETEPVVVSQLANNSQLFGNGTQNSVGFEAPKGSAQKPISHTSRIDPIVIPRQVLIKLLEFVFTKCQNIFLTCDLCYSSSTCECFFASCSTYHVKTRCLLFY